MDQIILPESKAIVSPVGNKNLMDQIWKSKSFSNEQNNNTTPLTASPSRFTTTPDTRNLRSLSITRSVSATNLASSDPVGLTNSQPSQMRPDVRRHGIGGALNLAELSHSLNSLGDESLHRSASENEYGAAFGGLNNHSRFLSDRDVSFDPRNGDMYGEGRTTGYSSEDFYSGEGSRRSDTDRLSQHSQHSLLPATHFPPSHNVRSLAYSQADDRLNAPSLDPYASEVGSSADGSYDQDYPGRYIGAGINTNHYGVNTGGPPDNISPVISGFDGFVYKVQFKKTHRNFLRSAGIDRPIRNGDFVVVEADRGEDLGVVCEVQSMPAFFREGGSLFAKDAKVSAWGDRRSGVKHILRHALPQEYSLLPVKYAEEMSIVEVCRAQSQMHLLPMMVVDAEYQFDRHKLTIFYESHSRRIDFRELVRDLFAIYKTRIWMEAVSYSFRPHRSAAHALATGLIQTENPPHTGSQILRPDSGFSLADRGTNSPFDPASSAEPLSSVGGRGMNSIRQPMGDPSYVPLIPFNPNQYHQQYHHQQQQHSYARPIRQPKPPPSTQFDRVTGNGMTRAPMVNTQQIPDYEFGFSY